MALDDVGISSSLVVVQVWTILCPCVCDVFFICQIDTIFILDVSCSREFLLRKILDDFICLLAVVFFPGFLLFHCIVFRSIPFWPFSCLSWSFCWLFVFIFSSFFLTFFSFLLVSHISRISAVAQGCTLRRRLPSTSSASFVITVLKLLVNVSASSSRVASSGANFPPITTWKVSTMGGSFNLSGLSLTCLACLGCTPGIQHVKPEVSLMLLHPDQCRINH